MIKYISILAPRMWGDAHANVDRLVVGEFQSSPHVCEATPDLNNIPACLPYFNPRPTYVRRRLADPIYYVMPEISILAPRMWGDYDQ